MGKTITKILSFCNKHARKTELTDIENTIMQGTVFGSIICTAVIDKLAKKIMEIRKFYIKTKKK